MTPTSRTVFRTGRRVLSAATALIVLATIGDFLASGGNQQRVLAAAYGQKIEVEAQRDPSADFAALRTYTWLASPPAKTDVAPGAMTNPNLSQEVLGPHIEAAVDRELTARGLKRVDGGESDVQVVYYAALTVGISGDELGSYYQYTTGWAVVPLGTRSRTTSDIVERGSIVVDVVAPASKKAIWRGSVQTKVSQETTLPKRIERIDDGMRRLFERFPLPRAQKR